MHDRNKQTHIRINNIIWYYHLYICERVFNIIMFINNKRDAEVKYVNTSIYLSISTSSTAIITSTQSCRFIFVP